MKLKLFFVFIIFHLLNNVSITQQEIVENKLLTKIPYKANHNLKLVRLKKVRKVFTDSQSQLNTIKNVNTTKDEKTVVNLDIKYNVVNQKPKSFLLNEISGRQNLISIGNSNYGSNEKKINYGNILASNKNKLKFPQSNKLKNLKKIDFNKENEKTLNKNFSVINKKNLPSINVNDVSKKIKENLIFKEKISSKLNSKKITLTTTSKPTISVKNKKNLNKFESKSYITLPPTLKKTTVTYKPYIHSVLTTSLPVLKVRRSHLKLKEPTDNPKNLELSKIFNDKKFENKKFSTKKNDLDFINSNRKYSKIKFSNGLIKNKIELKLNQSETTTTIKPFLTTIKSFITTIKPFLSTNKPIRSTSTPTNKILLTTSSSINEVKNFNPKTQEDKSKTILFATRKKPLTQRTRSVNLTEKNLNLISNLVKPETTTLKTIPYFFTKPLDEKNILKKETKFKTKTRSLPDNLNNEKILETTTVSASRKRKNNSYENVSILGKIDISKDLNKIPIFSHNSSKNLTLSSNIINLTPRKPKWSLKNSINSFKQREKPIYSTQNQLEVEKAKDVKYLELKEEKINKISTIKPPTEVYNLITKMPDMNDKTKENLIENLYQKTKPKAFLLNENFNYENKKDDRLLQNLVNKKENYQDYQEPRIHKESKLVEKTYVFSTIRPNEDFIEKTKIFDLNKEKPNASENNEVLSKSLKNIIFLRNKEYIKPILNYPHEERLEEIGKVSKKSIELFQKQAPIPYFAPEKKNELFDLNKENLKTNEVNEFPIKYSKSSINEKDNLSLIYKPIDNFEPQKKNKKTYEEELKQNFKSETDLSLTNEKINNDLYKKTYQKGFSDELKTRLKSFTNQPYVPNYLKKPDYFFNEKPILKQDLSKKKFNKFNEVDFIKSDKLKLNLIKNLNDNFKETKNNLPLKETMNQNIFEKPFHNKNFNINKIPARVFYDKYNSQYNHFNPKKSRKTFEETKYSPMNNENINIPSNLFNKPKNNYSDRNNEKKFVVLKKDFNENSSVFKPKNYNKLELVDDYKKIDLPVNENYIRFNSLNNNYKRFKPLKQDYNKIEPFNETYREIKPINENYDSLDKNVKNYNYHPKNAGHFDENKKMNNFNQINKNFDFKSQFLDNSLPEMTLLQHSIIQHDVPVKK